MITSWKNISTSICEPFSCFDLQYEKSVGWKHHICKHSISEFEKKAIVASAMAQEATGAPVSFHPGRDPEAPFEIMRIFAEAGGNTKKSICSHLESK